MDFRANTRFGYQAHGVDAKKNNINWQHLMAKIRIDKAEQILLQTERSLCNIAEEVGFYKTKRDFTIRV